MRLRCALWLYSAIAFLGACDATSNAPPSAAHQGAPEPRSQVSAASAELTLGDKRYHLDFALCVIEDTDAVWISASDKRKRPEFPSLRIRYFPERVVNPPVFSIEFHQTEPHILWRLETGSIRPTASGHDAEGTLNATQMTNGERGRRMLPMGDAHNRNFTLDVQC